jgi:hypothetical protein
MTLMSPGDLAMVRTAMLGSFNSSSTNGRTGATRACRIWAAKRNYHIPGLPPFMRIPTWHIALPDGDAVAIGDTETSPGKGVYIVSEVLNPVDYSANTDVVASRVKDASGVNIPIFIPNYNPITIKNVNTGQTVSIPVFIEPYDHDVRLSDYDPEYRWSVWFDPRTLYLDGSAIQANHTIYCLQFGAMADGVTPRPVALSSPRIQTGVLPIACAYVKERPHAG